MAKELGIHGGFSREAADRLFRGMHPELVDGKEVKLTQRIDKDRVGAVDWTFNVDKSVSGVALLGGDTRVIDAHYQAVRDGMAELEKRARVRVRKSAAVAKAAEEAEGKAKVWKYPARYTDSLLYELYVHGSSREGDCHLHTHAKIYNLSKDPVENRVKALELGFVSREDVNRVYRQSLKKGLNQLGYKTTLNGKEIAISGFPAEVKGLFSKGHERVERIQQTMEAKIGKPMTSKAKGKLSLYDRPEKAPDVPLEERRKGWLAQMTDRQVKAVRGLVSRAKASVTLDRWHEGVRRGYEAFRSRAMGVSHEREHGRSR